MEAFFTMFYQGLRDLGAVEMVQQSEIVKIFVKKSQVMQNFLENSFMTISVGAIMRTRFALLNRYLM
jgi:hypothetical protein